MIYSTCVEQVSETRPAPLCRVVRFRHLPACSSSPPGGAADAFRAVQTLSTHLGGILTPSQLCWGSFVTSWGTVCGAISPSPSLSPILALVRIQSLPIRSGRDEGGVAGVIEGVVGVKADELACPDPRFAAAPAAGKGDVAVTSSKAKSAWPPQVGVQAAGSAMLSLSSRSMMSGGWCRMCRG